MRHELRHAVREFQSFGDEAIALTDGWEVVKKTQAATFSNLEGRGKSFHPFFNRLIDSGKTLTRSGCIWSEIRFYLW